MRRLLDSLFCIPSATIAAGVGFLLSCPQPALAAPSDAPSTFRPLPTRDRTLELKTAFDALNKEYSQIPSSLRIPRKEFLTRRGYPASPRAERAMSCFDSERYPITVCYFKASDEPFAKKLLAPLETAWQKQVVEMGWTAPSTNANYETLHTGIDVYVDETESARPPFTAYGATVPGDVNSNAPNYACPSYIMIGAFGSQDSVNLEELQLLIHHEFHHSIQMATDCSENGFSFEAGAQWMQAQFGPEDALTVGDIVTELYQENPNRPFAYHTLSGELAGYQYGGFLLYQYIQEALGAKDPKTIKTLWDGTCQPPAQTENEPDLLDSLSAMYPSLGRKDIVMGFGEWRAFVGNRNDGQHFEHAGAYYSLAPTPVNISGSVNSPVQKTISDVYELGYGYLELEKLPSHAALSVSAKTSSQDIDWGVNLYALKEKAIVSKVEATQAEDGSLEAVLPQDAVQASDSVLLILGNAGRPDLDMDTYARFQKSDFEISIKAIEQAAPEDAGADTDAAPDAAIEADANEPVPPPTDGTDSGCSFSAAPPIKGSGMGSAFLAILGIGAIRRRPKNRHRR